jgi:LuxR family maltose regulon positive regulatory protein
MPESLLRTRLTIPTPRPERVRRERLHTRLDSSLAHKLTLVSAPAGFGKTTAVSDWLYVRDLAAAWLTLDAADSDPAHLLRYLTAALQCILPHLNTDINGALQSAQPNYAAVLADLINAVEAVDTPCILVLDDYHHTDATAIDQLLDRLLSYQPTALHLILISRTDPALPLARLRAQGDLLELRAADLRFTPDEVATFLRDTLEHPSSPAISAALARQTEGWIAGLQLAALALRQSDDPAAFVAAFTGSHRYIIDYLTDEVLAQQPDAIRHFLLYTSILEQMCAPLCDALLEQMGTQAMLEQLEVSNLFVQPLDAERCWYRYHQLFGGVLRQRLAHTFPDQIAALHRRAAIWSTGHGMASAAVRHALATGDPAFAAQTVEQHAATALRWGEATTVGRWLDSLGAEVVSAHPGLALQQAWVCYFANDIARIEPLLARVEALLDQVAAAQQSAMRGDVAALRAWVAFRQGAFTAAITCFREALACLPAQAHSQRGVNFMFLGDALQQVGETRQAAASYATSIPLCRQADNIAAVMGATLKLAMAYRTLGALRHAYAALQEAWAAVHTRSPQPPSIVYLHLGLGDVTYEQNELDQAAIHIQAGLELVWQRHTLTHVQPLLLLAQARLRLAQGDPAGACAILQQVDEEPQVQSDDRVAALVTLRRVQIWLLQGDLTAAQDWSAALDPPDPALFSGELLLISQARVLLARGCAEKDSAALDAALALLEQLQTSAQAAGRAGHLLLIRILQALTHAALDQRQPALAALAQALTLAAPEGFVRVFLDEGAAMANLLTEAITRRVVPTYASRLLAAFPASPPAPADRTAQAQARLVEPLTERELDVLRLLAAGQPNRAIAARLVLATGTVKVHTRNIYGKLGVSNRTQAVTRAQKLGLL